MRGKKVLATFLAMVVSLSCFCGGGGITVKAMNQSGEEESIEKETEVTEETEVAEETEKVEETEKTEEIEKIEETEETNNTNQEIRNLALKRPTRASAYLEANGQYPARTPNLAVDGNSSEGNSRWQSGEDKEIKEQWIEIQLRTDSLVSEIKVKFFAKLYGNFVIETSKTNDENAEWVEVGRGEMPPSTDMNLTKVVDLKENGNMKHVERYVRLRFTSGNTNAANMSIGVYEIEINGVLDLDDGEVLLPESAQDVVDSISSLQTITNDMEEVPLPKAPEGYEIRVKGSEYSQVISDDGKISNYNIYDYDQDIIIEAVNKENEEDKAEKSFNVHVPNKRNKNASLFPQVNNANKEPKVIPSIQEWYGYEGEFNLNSESKIIIQDNAELGIKKVAEEFQGDMKDITGWTLEIVEGGDSGKSDIVLTSTKTDEYDTGEEGYLLVADDNGIKISSSGYNGCLYGLMTLEQVFYTQKKEFTFPKGVIRDFPQYEIRGVMIDIARAPYRIEALQDLVKSFAFYKINEVQFHLNDNRHIAANGDRGDYDYWKNAEAMFRLESDLFPSLKTDDKDDEYYNEVYGGSPQYSKEEYKELQKLAMSYGINPISEIDAPGHSLLFTKYVRNNLEEVQKVLPQIKGNINNPRDWELLSLTGESGDWAIDFMETLYGEYLDSEDPVFLGDTVNIGIDEYWKIQDNEYEGMREYINRMAEKVKESGKEVRMWASMVPYFDNKGVDAKQYNDIVIDFWSDHWDNAVKRVSEGFKIVNADSNHLYGNPGRDYRDIVNIEHIFNNWDPTIISGGNLKKGEPNLLGAKTSLWADINNMGVTERDSQERLLRQAAVLSEKTWGGTDKDQSFEEYSFKYESLREGPGATLGAGVDSKSGLVMSYDFTNEKDGIIYDASGNGYDGKIKNGQIVKEDGEAWLKLDGTGEVTTTLKSLDYPYTVQFDLKLSDADNREEDICLFDGYDGRLTVKKNGNLGLNRVFFNQDFGYKIPTDEKVELTVVGTQQVTKLYVNGKLQSVLSRTTGSETDYDHLLSTFVFPLTSIGSGLDGKIANIKAYNKALSPEILDKMSRGESVSEVNVSQDKGAAGVAQHKGDGGQDIAWKKLRVGWKALDGDGNALDGSHETNVSEKDSYFEGAYADSSFAVDMQGEYDISKLVLQWDNPPQKFMIQQSKDGETWTDIQEVAGQSVNEIIFEEPVCTQYLRVKGLQNNGNTFKLREFEAYEQVEKSALESIITQAEEKVQELDLSYSDKKGYDIFFDAYVMAKALNESVIAEQAEIDVAKESLQIALDSLTEKPEYIKVEKIELSAEKDALEIGEQIKVTGVITPDNATDKTLKWETSDSEVLEVDENGTVTAIKEGEAFIKAISPDNVEAEIKFTVKEKTTEKPEYIKVEKIELFAERDALEIGEQIKITGVITPDNATDKTLKWETSDPEVLEVDENGTVTTIKEGKASIKAISPDNVQAELIFTVKEKITEKEDEENPEVEIKPEDNNGKEDLPKTGAGVTPVATVALAIVITNIGFYLNKKKDKWC